MRADRLLSIMLILQDQGKQTVARLAETLEVSRRTVLRDINALTLSGVPVYSESGPGGGVYLDEKYRVSLTGLKAGELRSLFTASLTGPLSDMGLRQSAESGFLKLLAALSPVQRNEVERIRQRLYIDPSAWSNHSQPQATLAGLLEAVFADRRLHLTYKRSDGEIVERTLDPYSLVCKATIWYLLASYKERIQIYRVSRIQHLVILDENFVRSKSFDLTQFWTAQLEQYREYAPPFTCTLEVKEARLQFLTWPFIYDYEALGKASREGWQTVKLTFDSVEAAEMVVLALTQDVRILEPASLLETVRQKSAALNALYHPTPITS
ncbi:MAG TPA: YafY family protein [Chloroflexia bacterium]|nr:YafY family protein [Chloroflexia bacterium]